MSEERLAQYLKHIDNYGVEMIQETAEHDKQLTDQEKQAVVAYLAIHKPKRRKT